MRYFRTDDAEVYEGIRFQLDVAWGHPTPDGKTLTCIEPAATAPRDLQGRILLAVQDAFAEYEAAYTMLPQVLASGAVEEITAAEYLPVDDLARP